MFPIGHLHVPRVEPPTDKPASEKKHSKLRNYIIETVKTIIKLALPNLKSKSEK